IWCFSPFYAWGLLTANPYAIRALEKTTHRRCDPTRIKANVIKLLNFGEKHVWYINRNTERNIDDTKSMVNTNFPVDLSGLSEMLRNITDVSRPWKLGNLIEGWEWFAFTFNDQNPIELSNDEIEKMLETSDSIVHEAYSRMPMDDAKQTWAQYTVPEIDFIIRECGLKVTDKIIDIGCGMGRHSIELSNRGFTNIVGVDLIENLIEAAKKKLDLKNPNVKFKIGDICKKDIPELNEKYDCILCLYDVVGSYANYDKNIQMIENISSLLQTGGYLVLSVMNLHYTEQVAKNKFKLSVSTKELLSLPSSKTMETSGNVFNPEYFLLDTESKVVYRKEEFSPGSSIPKELIVRDRRFYKQEIEDMCTSFGLEVCSSKAVNAGWERGMELTTGKEILLVCRKK
ncbi:MAG TPA: class I SAM-dependent methyltransferase, partial [Mucilaginibacter sp.]|nr:class I SAM-dependent methyltransferase [Mucilaginibacter sp.]